jgi:hypothetical protein
MTCDASNAAISDQVVKLTTTAAKRLVTIVVLQEAEGMNAHVQ